MPKKNKKPRKGKAALSAPKAREELFDTVSKDKKISIETIGEPSSFKGDGLRVLALFVPFVMTVWITGGIFAKDTATFCLLISGFITTELVRTKGNLFSGSKNLLPLLPLVLALATYGRTQDEVGAGFVFLIIGLRVLALKLEEFDLTFGIILRGLVTPLMCVLGGWIQTGMVFPELLAFGIAPSLLSISSELILKSTEIEKLGWGRVRYRGEEPARLPGSLAQMILTIFLLGAALPPAISLFELLPPTFAISAMAIFYLQRIAEGYLNEEDDLKVSYLVAKIAAISCLLPLSIFIF